MTLKPGELVRVTVPGVVRDALAVVLQQGEGVNTDMYEVRLLRSKTIIWVHVDNIRYAPQGDRR